MPPVQHINTGYSALQPQAAVTLFRHAAGGMLYWLMLAAAVFLSGSCTTVQHCSSNAADGNLGSGVNSPADDYALSRMSTTLLFTTSRPRTDVHTDIIPNAIPEAVFETTRRSDGSFSEADINRSLPVNVLRVTSPATAATPDGTTIMVFAKQSGAGRTANMDLYQSTMSNGVWSEPVILSTLISSGYDAQPALAHDGSFVVFCSDRAGGRGGIDLYISYRNGGAWLPPQNMGETINSSGDDITPSISAAGDLLFASRNGNGRSTKDFDLMRALRTSETAWTRAEAFPQPINSRADDISPIAWGDSIVFASKRAGGCGGYDIYALPLCGPVIMRGSVVPSRSVTRMGGVITILDSLGKFLQYPVREDGKYEFKLLPNRSYILRYKNACLPDPIEQPVGTPCDFTHTVVLQTTLTLPELDPVFTFSEFNIPFFASGYYMPNTSEHLTALRTKFAYNLLGISDSTEYIGNPGSEYDELAPIVDSAVNAAAAFVLKAIQYRKEGCVTSGAKITVNIDGYVDPRPFAAGYRYDGISIADDSF
ncbi:MAG: PD40 domain-containing protein, partial [Candidatus Kapabacteria bacterium]|nr:PD40 domain-containing protein [Candidatus Kapabacteria bacterium]